MMSVRVGRLFSRGAAAATLALASLAGAVPPEPVGDPVLRLSPSLGTTGEASQEQRELAREAWRSLNMRPDQLVQQQRVIAERQLLEQLEAAKRQQAQMADVERRLAEVRAQRYANPLVYALAALVAAAGVAAFMVWRRTRSAATSRAGWQQPGEGVT